MPLWFWARLTRCFVFGVDAGRPVGARRAGGSTDPRTSDEAIDEAVRAVYADDLTGTGD